MTQYRAKGCPIYPKLKRWDAHLIFPIPVDTDDAWDIMQAVCDEHGWTLLAVCNDIHPMTNDEASQRERDLQAGDHGEELSIDFSGFEMVTVRRNDEA